MICSKNAQNLAKNARHSAHHNFTRKCPKCPIFSLFPASSPPKMPTFMPKQKTHIPFFAQNIVKFCIFWAGPDNFWKCPKKGPGPTMVFSASKPFKMPDMGRNAHFWSPCSLLLNRFSMVALSQVSIHTESLSLMCLSFSLRTNGGPSRNISAGNDAACVAAHSGQNDA